MDLYRDNILDHYKNPLCGDKICIQIKLQTTNYKLQTIQDIKFSGVGCAISIASASLLTEKVKNMDLAKVQRLKTKDIVDMLGITLTPTRLKCALLSLEVLQKALNK